MRERCESVVSRYLNSLFRLQRSRKGFQRQMNFNQIQVAEWNLANSWKSQELLSLLQLKQNTQQELNEVMYIVHILNIYINI